ncbi:DUF1800 domain-containing protein [Xylophilus sp. Leaf220]|uniref:DUF1800 domain-containing protein n=1 Tax=Xylophilus sp. Leaf220 TaxID=1735686 RepID=UPI0009E76091
MTASTLAPAGDRVAAVPLPETGARPPAPPAPQHGRTVVPAALAAAVLQACGGGGGDESLALQSSDGGAAQASSDFTATLSSTSAAAVSAEQAARFLLQAQFSASDDEIAAVRSLGYAGWLARQYAVAPGITGWDWLNLRGYAAIDNATRYYDNSYPADYMVWHQLFNAPDAVRKRVALALSEIFVVSTSGINASWRGHLMASWWDMLSANALGNFRTLLQDVTLHPAMGVYLNTRGNQKENAATGRQPDENYAREVMQLMTIGLTQLNADGSPKTGSNGAPLDTYTQSDITNLARVFTGYDFDQRQNVVTTEPVQNRAIGNTAFARLPMVLNAGLHSSSAVSFLGNHIAAGTDGAAALKQALDTLFQHPNVGPFIGRQLIQRLVTSNPSRGYVGRVAAIFANNGRGVRGDLAATVAAVLLDSEARSATGLADASFGRLREPVLRLVQWGRSFGLRSAAGSWKIGNLSNPASQLAQSPLQSPSVFNFFRPGYVPPGTAIASAGGVAPEFQLVNESSVGGYLNFMQGVVRNGLYVNAPDLPQAASNASNGFDLTAAYTREKALAADAPALVAKLNLVLAAGQLSGATVALIVGALNATPVTAASTDAVKLNRIAAAVLMVMAAPEYLIQK